ncbi:MAG: FecR family protein, partial [Ignavibacteriae bacterium]|nr:FecR family protein [Ignavibacteriota bacterium]
LYYIVGFMNKKLILKYLEGTSSVEDTKLIEEWILQSKENISYFNQIKTEYTIDTFESVSSETSVDKSYQDFESKHIRSKNFRSKYYVPVLKYAAVLLILFTSSYFIYIYQAGTKEFVIPNNAITLELQDGTKKVIDEQGTQMILDNNGEVIGKQEGKQLTYHKSASQKELVYNTLTVPYGKTFELKLSDGTVAHLNAGSSMTYPVEFIDGKNREISITGEAYLNVAKDALHPFIVNTKGLNVRVLGTQFNVSAYPEDTVSEIVLVEGSVAMYEEKETYNSERATLLEPGFKGSFDKQKQSITKNKVITSSYTSWINGELVFRNMTFENILKKLERHYDVVILNNNKELSQKKFNANFGKEPIANVLEELNKYYGIKYQFKNGNQVVIE